MVRGISKEEEMDKEVTVEESNGWCTAGFRRLATVHSWTLERPDHEGCGHTRTLVPRLPLPRTTGTVNEQGEDSVAVAPPNVAEILVR